MRTVYFTGIHTGKGHRSQWIYCELRDAITDELIVASTMEYAVVAVRDRSYIVVPAFVGYQA